MSEEQTGEEQIDEEVQVQPLVSLPDPNVANAPIVAIRGQQAIGIPNIVSQTDKTNLDKIEMLYDPIAQQVQPDELLTEQGKYMDTSQQRQRVADPRLISGIQDVSVQDQDAAQIQNVERTFSNMITATAAKGTITENDVVDPNQVVDERTKQQMLERGSLAEAQTQTLANEASIAFQIEKLTEGMETGQFPPWASPTVRKINEIMQQRGLGSSSMAAAALAQGLIESTIPIAAQDAQANATLQLQNLNNQQQTALANAATIAAMDRQNLDNRMKAAQQNAQSFLNMNLKNTTNEQQAAVLTFQSKAQSLFTDQAAANAAQQFNATSQNQVNQFYDQLGATVEQANAARDLAIQKFNSEETTAVEQFNVNLDNVREQFNIAMRQQIDQSNTTWRRQINTANTANQNAANKTNAAILLGLTQQAQNQLWQKYRDEAHQLFAALQNETQRNHQIVVTAMQNQFNTEMFDRSIDFKKQVAAGAASQSLLNNAIEFGTQVLTQKVPTSSGEQSLLGAGIGGVFNFLGLSGDTGSEATSLGQQVIQFEADSPEDEFDISFESLVDAGAFDLEQGEDDDFFAFD
jgi:hypothetical protein